MCRNFCPCYRIFRRKTKEYIPGVYSVLSTCFNRTSLHMSYAVCVERKYMWLDGGVHDYNLVWSRALDIAFSGFSGSTSSSQVYKSDKELFDEAATKSLATSKKSTNHDFVSVSETRDGKDPDCSWRIWLGFRFETRNLANSHVTWTKKYLLFDNKWYGLSRYQKR